MRYWSGVGSSLEFFLYNIPCVCAFRVLVGCVPVPRGSRKEGNKHCHGVICVICAASAYNVPQGDYALLGGFRTFSIYNVSRSCGSRKESNKRCHAVICVIGAASAYHVPQGNYALLALLVRIISISARPWRIQALAVPCG
jgi:hypothetical protein